MSIFEIVLLGVALAMDAVAVSLTDGMTMPDMRLIRALETAGAFGLFQFFMPLLGYLLGAVFAGYVASVAPVLSFLILALLGGKMLFGCIRELARQARAPVGRIHIEKRENKSGALKLFIEALATSIDALAIGITLLALEASGTLALPPLYAALIIGAVTFALSLSAVFIGKKMGALIADRAEILGGTVLIFIGLKILLESV